MRNGIIDRFEENFAVVEINGVTEDIPKKELPNDCKVGDVLIFYQSKITIDTRESIIEEKKLMI
ncbi:DUF3006 domain-containing protein [Paenibacillus sp. EC2-1]|uniref:DUF3006 domain-containing protein n=1 Tax=Paenibacillus sp. EC2-1 TaxID=3388665 RepID=UPI003BEF242A